MTARQHGSGRLLRSVLADGIAAVGMEGMSLAQCPIQLRDVTQATGITFKHTDGSCGRWYALEPMSAGLALLDYDGDGDLDIYFLNGAPLRGTKVESPPKNALYRNDGRFHFTDVTDQAGVGDTGYGLGVAVGDFDNDGDRDLLIASGHLSDNVERYDDTTSYHARNHLLMNTGDGRFVNVSRQCGDGLAVKLSSRGLVLGDLDNDGDMDAVIQNSRREPTVLKNQSPVRNHWVQFRLRGVKTNRDGVGARVKVVSVDLTQIDEVHSGQGYQSHFGMQLHFGLGQRNRIDRVEVRWIGGGLDVLEHVTIDRIWTISEGASSTARQTSRTTARPR